MESAKRIISGTLTVETNKFVIKGREVDVDVTSKKEKQNKRRVTLLSRRTKDMA